MIDNHEKEQITGTLTERLENVIYRLGFDGDAGLVRSWAEFRAVTKRHVVRQAFEAIGARAVFGFYGVDVSESETFCPIMYLCIAPDDESAKDIHRLVWSQGVVPLLLIATPASLQVRRSLAPPPEQPIAIPWDKLKADDDLPPELTSLTGVALRSSIVWRDFMIDRSSRVDKALLDGITSLGDAVQKENEGLARETIHALIGRFLYFYVLIDRGIIDPKWISGIRSESGAQACGTIARSLLEKDSFAVWPTREVWALFDHIDSVMNGAIFPISKSKRRFVTDETLHLIHRVIRHGDTVGPAGHQLSRHSPDNSQTQNRW
jgi:hypothetical protein